jgi:hypothetical protein
MVISVYEQVLIRRQSGAKSPSILLVGSYTPQALFSGPLLPFSCPAFSCPALHQIQWSHTALARGKFFVYETG